MVSQIIDSFCILSFEICCWKDRSYLQVFSQITQAKYFLRLSISLSLTLDDCGSVNPESVTLGLISSQMVTQSSFATESFRLSMLNYLGWFQLQGRLNCSLGTLKYYLFSFIKLLGTFGFSSILSKLNVFFDRFWETQILGFCFGS